MIKKGTLVRFIGNEAASKIAKKLDLEDWCPDDIDDNTIGVCEEMVRIMLGGLEIYKCRFPVFISQHMSGRFYNFEIEEVSTCIK